MHTPVLLEETLRFLAVRPDGVYLDTTCGLGGHTIAVARQLTTGVVIACDTDEESLELARGNATEVADRVRFQKSRWSELRATLDAAGIARVDGLLADLGVSRFQLTEPRRGFSLMADGPLDMRMDPSQGITAAEVVNQFSERALADLIYQLGEERRAYRIARALVRARPISTTAQLAAVVESVVPRTGRLHPGSQTAMALRRYVNGEAEELSALLEALPEMVKSGGRAVVLTFMSLEDRVVKQAFQQLARTGRAVLLNKHVVTPSEEEVRSNPASRSSKLRALEMK